MYIFAATFDVILGVKHILRTCEDDFYLSRIRTACNSEKIKILFRKILITRTRLSV